MVLAFCRLTGGAWADAQTVKPGQIFRDCPDCPEMVVVPAGNFLMGLADDEAKRDAQQEPLLYKIMDGWRWTKTAEPQHPVNILKAFALGKYPITRGEFTLFAKETGFSTDQPCEVPGGRRLAFDSTASWQHPGFDQYPREPVVCVSWYEARAYVAWLNRKSAHENTAAQDGPYRLPSEAEWEYAARAGTRTTRWWGDALGKDNAVCTHCGSPWDNQQTAQVGLYGANAFGISDVLGNVWQWTADCWNENYAGAPENGSNWLTGNCDQRVLRGGSWRSDPESVTSTARLLVIADGHFNFAGFRVAKALQDTQ
jgi:formylglycine-generating enzyme required for sulfatase activity